MKLKLCLAIIAVLAMFAISATAQEMVTKGRLIDMDSSGSTIIVETKAKKGDEKQYVKYKLAKDVKWHICLEKECVYPKGVEGFRIINDYAQFEAYGLPRKSYNVIIEEQKNNEVTSLQVEIVAGKHKK